MPDSEFRQALQRHSDLRCLAYRRVEGIARQIPFLPDVRITEIDEPTLQVWRRTWQKGHPLGYGGWDWPTIIAPVWRRPAAFHLALWSGECLCGMAAGRVSKRRGSGIRHTLSIHFLEGNPDPRHPLRKHVAPLALAGAEAYGALLGAWRLRLIDPLPGVFRLYAGLGFSIARSPSHRLLFEKRIEADEPLRL